MAVRAQADLFTGQLFHRQDVDGFQEVAALLNAGFQLLLNSRGNGKHYVAPVYVVQSCLRGKVGGKQLARFVLHGEFPLGF